MVQKEEWRVVCSPCVSASPCPLARHPAVAHRLPSPSRLSLWIAEASEALLLKAGGWGAACTYAGVQEDALGMVWEGRGVLLLARWQMSAQPYSLSSHLSGCSCQLQPETCL